MLISLILFSPTFYMYVLSFLSCISAFPRICRGCVFLSFVAVFFFFLETLHSNLYFCLFWRSLCLYSFVFRLRSFVVPCPVFVFLPFFFVSWVISVFRFCFVTSFCQSLLLTLCVSFFLSFCGSVFLSFVMSCIFFHPVLPFLLSFRLVFLSCFLSFVRFRTCRPVRSFLPSVSFFFSFLLILSFFVSVVLSSRLPSFLSFFPSSFVSSFLSFFPEQNQKMRRTTQKIYTAKSVFRCPEVVLPGKRNRNRTSNEINTHDLPHFHFVQAWVRLNEICQEFGDHIEDS